MTDDLKTIRERTISDLKESICEVVFTKLNGELRTMNCTLRADMLPPAPKKDEGAERANVKRHERVSEDTISVWDLDKQGWRGFRVDSIKSVMKK